MLNAQIDSVTAPGYAEQQIQDVEDILDAAPNDASIRTADKMAYANAPRPPCSGALLYKVQFGAYIYKHNF